MLDGGADGTLEGAFVGTGVGAFFVGGGVVGVPPTGILDGLAVGLGVPSVGPAGASVLLEQSV